MRDVYILLNPLFPGKYTWKYMPFSLLYKPIYVGIGNSAKKRFLAHIREARNSSGKNLLKNRTIKNILDAGRDPLLYVVVESISDYNACYLEQYFIGIIRRRENGGSLTNITSGGDGLSSPTSETREKIRISALNQSEEKKNSIRRAHLGKVVKEETKEKLRNINTGKKQTQETIEKRKASLDAIRTNDLHMRMGASQRGKIRSEEHSKRISEGLKLAWERRKSGQSAAKPNVG